MPTEGTAKRETAGAGSGARHWFVLVVVSIAQPMVVLDVTVVNIALPSAQADLRFGNDARQWVITAYALAFGGLLLLGGRVGDVFGRRRIFLISLEVAAGHRCRSGIVQAERVMRLPPPSRWAS